MVHLHDVVGRMKKLEDKDRHNTQFDVGDMLFLRIVVD